MFVIFGFVLDAAIWRVSCKCASEILFRQLDLQCLILEKNCLQRQVLPKAFRLTLFRGYRQNEVEILPNWFIYRKEEISLVKAVANKKGFRR